MKIAAARRKLLLQQVMAGVTDTESLAALCGVSISTIRRDLGLLSRHGALFRTYGGAAPINPLPSEQPYANRIREKSVQKHAIARVAAGLIEDGETIILDAGTTVSALAMELRERSDLHVVTNSWTAVQTLHDRDQLKITMLGGQWRSISMGFIGPHAEQALRRITAKRVFLGADGVVAGRGICEATVEQVGLKEQMIAQAEAVYVLATSEKLGQAASEWWVPLDRPWTLITERGASAEQLESFRRLGHVTIMTGEF